MPGLDPQKLHVRIAPGMETHKPLLPRTYTLTHSDATGDLFLTVAPEYDIKQISGLYTRFMRDEVLGEWASGESTCLVLHCHLSGGFILGGAKWRLAIFRQHMPLVLQVICHGDRAFLEGNHALLGAPVEVRYHARRRRDERVEPYGVVWEHLPAGFLEN